MSEKQYEISIREPWFSLIKTKNKGIEVRLDRGVFAKINEGDIVKWYKTYKNNKYYVATKIIKVARYKNIDDLFENEMLRKILPGFPTVECGKIVYEEIYKDDLKNNGIISFHLKTLKLEENKPELRKQSRTKKNKLTNKNAKKD